MYMYTGGYLICCCWGERRAYVCPGTLVGPFPTARSEACSDRSDEVGDCKLHITLTENCTGHRLHPAHDTIKIPHITKKNKQKTKTKSRT